MKIRLFVTVIFSGFLMACNGNPIKSLCESTGGKYGSVRNECIRPSCAKTKTCGNWANPRQYCPQVKIGMDKDTVRFWLGEPKTDTATLMIWDSGKMDNGDITATFEQNKLIKLDCSS